MSLSAVNWAKFPIILFSVLVSILNPVFVETFQRNFVLNIAINLGNSLGIFNETASDNWNGITVNCEVDIVN